jgi:hypothetical protein
VDQIRAEQRPQIPGLDRLQVGAEVARRISRHVQALDRDVDMAPAQRNSPFDEVRSSRKPLRIWPVGRRNSIVPVASNPPASLAASFMTLRGIERLSGRAATRDSPPLEACPQAGARASRLNRPRETRRLRHAAGGTTHSAARGQAARERLAAAGAFR